MKVPVKEGGENERILLNPIMSPQLKYISSWFKNFKFELKTKFSNF